MQALELNLKIKTFVSTRPTKSSSEPGALILMLLLRFLQLSSPPAGAWQFVGVPAPESLPSS
jgi:hypothetical protein